ncbi:3'-5' exonuclease family protein [Halomicrobium katesii]|uniref:hypothetical protein n=1 Tax=Halomicrobium katesii TaxID=437163 RepID=UPI0003807DA2|nr:hypothetical protein [Halomicrobium katesii]
MGLLAIDIETASPFEEPSPGDNDTRYYEWVVTSVAYQDNSQAEPETDVLFRRGGWDAEFTADMIDQLLEWCDERKIDRVATYNGVWFDLKHIGTWAKQLEENGLREDVYSALCGLFEGHVDLALAAADQYSDELWEDQEVLPDWKAYQLAGIDNDSVWYDDYGFDAAYFEALGIEDNHVKCEHVGQVLGERYVDGIIHGLEETSTHRELEQLLRDYAESDVTDLFRLHDHLGGGDLKNGYHYPMESIIE